MVTSNFIDGVTNVADSETLGSFIALDPTAAFVFFDDFYRFQVADWTITENVTAAVSIADVAGGVLSVVNDPADNDHYYVQSLGTPFSLQTAGKQAWFKTRFALDVVDESDVFVGLYVTDTTPVAGIVDGVYLHKADGDTTLQLVVVKDSTATTTDITEMVADEYVTVGWRYDGGDNIDIYLADVRVASCVTDNLPDDVLLTPSFAVQNGAAAAVTLLLDYIFAAYER